MSGEDPTRCPAKPKAPPTTVTVAHILVGWRGSLPDGGPDRDEAQAQQQAVALVHKARQKGADFLSLMHAHSDDPGAGVHTLDKASRRRFVRPFVDAASGVGVGQITLARSRFGFHVIARMPDDFEAPPPPLDPVVRADCPQAGEDAARCPRPLDKTPAQVVVRHILIGYKGSLTRRRDGRTEAMARKLATQLVHQARRPDGDFAALQKAHSDDPGDGVYKVTPTAVLAPEFRRRALSLGVGQVGAVRSRYGFHVILRQQ